LGKNAVIARLTGGLAGSITQGEFVMTVAQGASKALRGASNRLAKKLGSKVKHTRSPRKDFDQLLGDVRDPRKLALHYYEMGLRRGLICATDLMLDATLEIDKNGDVRAPKNIEVDVRLGLPARDVKPRAFKFKAIDLGFDA
jgi:hypothetical protein